MNDNSTHVFIPYVQIINLFETTKSPSVLIFLLINPPTTGGPIKELKAGHGVDYCRIFMSDGDYLRPHILIRN